MPVLPPQRWLPIAGRPPRTSVWAGLLAIGLATGPAHAALFEDATATLGPTAEWSNKVIVDDLDGDGDLDIAFANGGNYASAGDPEPNRLFFNDGTGALTSWTLPGDDLCRSIQGADLDGDGQPDLFVSGAHQTASRLFRGTGDPTIPFEETSGALPDTAHSIGDVVLGDVDADGDLDAVLADWGPGNPLSNGGAVTRLWLNDGAGSFSDVTAAQMPDTAVGMSWDAELADVDGDADLDVLVSSKASASSALFLNDGTGTFSDASSQLPAFSNNYEFAPMDIDADGDVDLVTINDGPGLGEHIFVNDGTGTFSDGTDTALPPAANLGHDDNVVEFVDLDDDGDPDFVIGSLSGPDRALINDGGVFSLLPAPTFEGPPTPGTLSLAFGDLDGDARPDAVMAQGETADTDRLYAGVDVAVDTHGPVLAILANGASLVARVHDRTTPVRAADLAVRLEPSGTPLTWMGGQLWRVDGTVVSDTDEELCATDRAGNTACIPLETPVDTGALPIDTSDPPDTASPGDTDAANRPCGCALRSDRAGPPDQAVLIGGMALLWLFGRRTRGADHGSEPRSGVSSAPHRRPSPPSHFSPPAR